MERVYEIIAVSFAFRWFMGGEQIAPDHDQSYNNKERCI